MIYGIGTDIVEYARIEQLWMRYGQRLASRLLSAQECLEFADVTHPARFLAKRFAAKEAFAKAVGSGLRAPVTLPCISICHDALGKPFMTFDSILRQHLVQLGIHAHHLSISDERATIIAFVILEAA